MSRSEENNPGTGEWRDSAATRRHFAAGLCVIALLGAADLLGLPGGGSVGQVAMFGCLPFWLQALLARYSSGFSAQIHAILFVILSCAAFLSFWSLLSSLGSEAPLRAGRVLLTMGAAFALISFFAGVLTPKRQLLVALTIALVMGAVSAFSLLGYANDAIREIVFEGSDRASATFKNPNQYGIVLSTTAPLVASLAMASRGRIRGLSAGSLLLMLVGLLLSGSKTNLILAAASLPALAILATATAFRGRKRIAYMITTIGGIIIAINIGLGALSHLNPRALRLLNAFFSTEQDVPSLISRQHVWDESLKVFQAHPVFGEGPGVPLWIIIDGPTITHSHNLFLEFARTLGVPGLVAISVMVIVVVGSAVGSVIAVLRCRPGNPGMRILTIGSALGCMNYLAANMTSESFGPSSSPFFWMVLFLLFSFHSRLFGENDSRLFVRRRARGFSE